MKTLAKLAIGSFFLLPCTWAGETDKFKISSHEHQHADACGHEAVPHGDHVDYVHDGHMHAMHSGHYDDHGLNQMAKSSRKTASTDHLTAKTHKHKHAKDCGHELVKHGDHEDYLHDGQYHAKHGGHYDLHGTPVVN